ncbi:MAG TPA: hypothetical protein VD859_10640 [Nocardioides sp.]|nr:hypothetical protein [Nocardioides sp.]
MTEREPTETAADGKDSGGNSGRGAVGFAGILLVVLVLVVLGSRGEIAQSWGVAGDPGTFTAESCGRDIVSGSGETTRAMCDGLFVPDDGGPPSEATLYYDGDPGETYDGRVDDEGFVYRTDWASRWSAVSLALIPLGLLWLAPGVWLTLRRPGVMTRSQKVRFLVLWLAPALAIMLLGGLGLLIGIATS